MKQKMAEVPEPYLRYLRLLGIDPIPGGVEGLRLVVRRHLCRVPFENVSKLLLYARERAGRVLTLGEFLDGVECQDLGGTCYSANPHLADLLRHLGYDVDLLGADMTNPNVHTCLRVRLEGVGYHVDAGYGGPFREPVRLDRLPYEFHEGTLRYVLDRNRREDVYEMAAFCGQERRHGYKVHPAPRDLAFFEPVIRDSFVPGSMFLTCLRVVRIFEDRSAELMNRTLTLRRCGQDSVTELNDMGALQAAFATHLAMPRCPVEKAVSLLEQFTGKPFFGTG